MRFCSTRVADRYRGLAFSLAAFPILILLAGACGSDKFRAQGSAGESDTSPVSGAAGESGAADLGASGGNAPSVGGASGSRPEDEGGAPNLDSGGTGGITGGSAGTGGKPAASCDCSPGSYCQDGTTTCRDCLDFKRLEFGPAQKLTTLANAPFSVERFPRPAPKSSALFYSSEVSAGEPRLWYSATPLSGIGAPISDRGTFESGPLFAAGLLAPQNFFFDRLDPATQRRKIMMGTWSGTTLDDVVLATKQLNRLDSSDYSVAVAAKVGHVYWMSTRTGKPELLYDPSTLSTELPPQLFEVQIKTGPTATCPRTGDDATPWVNLEGTLLLFRNQSLAENCQPNDSGAFDLFAVPLLDGLPATSAFSLSALNHTGGEASETDPSLSSDACSIYFASNSDNRDFDVYRAFRK